MNDLFLAIIANLISAPLLFWLGYLLSEIINIKIQQLFNPLYKIIHFNLNNVAVTLFCFFLPFLYI